MDRQKLVAAVLGLALAAVPALSGKNFDEPAALMGFSAEESELSSPVTRTFYTGSFGWYFTPGGASTSISASGYSETLRGGTISHVTACFYNSSAFSRSFRATASVRQGATTVQAITFQRDFPTQRFTCHQLSGFNAVLIPGEFEVGFSYNEFDADNFWAGIPATTNGAIFDVQIGSARPPFITGPQGPVQVHGIGIGYRIAEVDPPPPPAPCAPDDFTLCLLNGRFEVKATYLDYGDNSGFGHAVALTADSGYFWFFDASNVEAVGKVVSFCSINSSFGFYAGGLTDVGVVMTVRDTVADQTQTFTNNRGHNFDMISSAFSTCNNALPPHDPDEEEARSGEAVSAVGASEFTDLMREAAASASSSSDALAFAPARSGMTNSRDDENPGFDSLDASGAEDSRIVSTTPCAPDATTLCLLGDRFEVKATYTDYSNNTGAGQAVELTPDSGYFWFFDASNVEAVGKVVSFCSVNGSFGFYAGGLTDVGVVMTVRDTVANQTQTFTNNRGHNFNMISSAFNTCQ
jgi:hypothetical protein